MKTGCAFMTGFMNPTLRSPASVIQRLRTGIGQGFETLRWYAHLRLDNGNGATFTDRPGSRQSDMRRVYLELTSLLNGSETEHEWFSQMQVLVD